MGVKFSKKKKTIICVACKQHFMCECQNETKNAPEKRSCYLWRYPYSKWVLAEEEKKLIHICSQKCQDNQVLSQLWNGSPKHF